LVQYSTEDRFTAKYWREPKTFNPDRSLGDWNRDTFIPFSAGARSCIGRRYARIYYHLSRQPDDELSRFAEIESITTLALLVLHYEINVTEDPQFVHETWEQRRDRVMAAEQGPLSLTPKGVPLTFKHIDHEWKDLCLW
jgi:Cytochrome P450